MANDEASNGTTSSAPVTSTPSKEDDIWLGTEPNLLHYDEEKAKVQLILTQITSMEREEIARVDRSIPIRHLRAVKGDVTKALHSIQTTLQWRKEFGVDVIRSCFDVENTNQDTIQHQEMRDIFRKEAETGKMYIRSFDAEGRALMYMAQMRENTRHELNNMRYLVYSLEKAIACTKKKSGLEKIVLLIDFQGFTMRHSAPLSTARHTLDILQKRYPERMKRSFIMYPPLVFKAFWTMIKPFIDPVTKSKIVFCSATGQEVLDTVKHSDDLELRAYGTGATLRDFDAETYLRTPLDESY